MAIQSKTRWGKKEHLTARTRFHKKLKSRGQDHGPYYIVCAVTWIVVLLWLKPRTKPQIPNCSRVRCGKKWVYEKGSGYVEKKVYIKNSDLINFVTCFSLSHLAAALVATHAKSVRRSCSLAQQGPGRARTGCLEGRKRDSVSFHIFGACRILKAFMHLPCKHTLYKQSKDKWGTAAQTSWLLQNTPQGLKYKAEAFCFVRCLVVIWSLFSWPSEIWVPTKSKLKAARLCVRERFHWTLCAWWYERPGRLRRKAGPKMAMFIQRS